MKKHAGYTLVPALGVAAFFLAAPARAETQDVIIEQVPAAQPPPPQPAQPAQPGPTDQPAAPKPEEKKKSVPAGIRLDGGYALRTIEKISTTGADLGLGIGAQPSKHFAIYGAARGFFGSTEGGLGVKALSIKCDFDIVIDRFRIGFDPGLFFVGIDRATKDQTIGAWGPRLGAALRFDVFRADPIALFLRAAVDGGPTFSDGSLWGGATLGIGVDFDIKQGDRESL